MLLVLKPKLNNHCQIHEQVDNSTDIMELNTTMHYDKESDPNNNDVQVLASNYLAYKVGKLYSSQLSGNFFFFINLVNFKNVLDLNILKA